MLHGAPQMQDKVISTKAGLTGPEEQWRGRTKLQQGIDAQKGSIIAGPQGLSHNDAQSDRANYPSDNSQFGYLAAKSNIVSGPAGLVQAGQSEYTPKPFAGELQGIMCRRSVYRMLPSESISESTI